MLCQPDGDGTEMANNSPEYNAFSRPNKLPVEIVIGLVTAPMLVALVGSRVASNALQDIGRWSEELFRGDRLPSLNPPTTPSPISNTSELE